jgi:hypothetical protein
LLIFVSQILRYGVEQAVLFNQEENSHLVTKLDAEHQKLTVGDFTLRIFDKVTVEISVDEAKFQLRVLCVSPPIHKRTSIAVEDNAHSNKRSQQEVDQLDNKSKKHKNNNNKA